jgi:hypothetical protein
MQHHLGAIGQLTDFAGVGTQEFPYSAAFDMTFAEARIVTFQQLDLLLVQVELFF